MGVRWILTSWFPTEKRATVKYRTWKEKGVEKFDTLDQLKIEPVALTEELFPLLGKTKIGLSSRTQSQMGVRCEVLLSRFPTTKRRRVSKWGNEMWRYNQIRPPNREKPRQISQELKSRELSFCGFMSCSFRSAHNKIVVSSILLRPKRRAAQICAPLPP